MLVAYVDSSCLVALALGEDAAEGLATVLASFDALVASPLLEAELRSVLAREGVGPDAGPLLDPISWIHPDRPLTPELRRTLAVGYLRGADLWHVATALFLSPAPGDLWFLTLDLPQRAVAAALGFLVEP